MSKRALVVVRVVWLLATLGLMAWWREEALVLLVPLVLLGPLLREVAPPARDDERERLEDYRASHVALMSAYALLFLVFAKQQFVDGTGIAAEWLLMFTVPLLVRTALSIGRGVGARRLGLTVGTIAGTAWLAFSLVSHGLSWATLAEAWIGGGLLLFTFVASRWPRAGGALLACFSIALFSLVARQALGHGQWAFGLSMTALLVLPALMAGLALLVSAPRSAAGGRDEFSDLRGGASGDATATAAPSAWHRRPRSLGWIAATAVFLGCTAVLAALSAAPAKATAASTGPRKELLKAPRDIDGVPCAVRAFYDASGRLQTCTLSRDHVFPNGLSLPAGTQVTIDAEGRPSTAFLPGVTTLDGHRCIGDGTHNPMTNFHPNGKLRFCNLAEPQVIQGIPCQRSAFWIWITQGGAGTYFHDNGALRECLLADDVNVAGRTYRRREHITLDRDGQPVTAPGR